MLSAAGVVASLTEAMGIGGATVLATPYLAQGGLVGLSVRVPIAAADFDAAVRLRFCIGLAAASGLLPEQVIPTEHRLNQDISESKPIHS